MDNTTKLTIELYSNEAQTLINIINESIKAKGLDIAESGLFFVKKIQQAYKNAIKNDDDSDLNGLTHR